MPVVRRGRDRQVPAASPPRLRFRSASGVASRTEVAMIHGCVVAWIRDDNGSVEGVDIDLHAPGGSEHALIVGGKDGRLSLIHEETQRSKV